MGGSSRHGRLTGDRIEIHEHNGSVTDRPTVVTRRNRNDVPSLDFPLCAIWKPETHPARQNVKDVPQLAFFSPCRR
jgi:hypothetical protein